MIRGKVSTEKSSFNSGSSSVFTWVIDHKHPHHGHCFIFTVVPVAIPWSWHYQHHHDQHQGPWQQWEAGQHLSPSRSQDVGGRWHRQGTREQKTPPSHSRSRARACPKICWKQWNNVEPQRNFGPLWVKRFLASLLLETLHFTLSVTGLVGDSFGLA